MRTTLLRVLAVVLAVSCLPQAVRAEPPVVETYRVPMRDGVELATDVYLPSVDAKGLPCILVRTPYNKERYREENGSWASWGYAVAIQDVRGRFQSGGKGTSFEADGWGELQDGYDTIEWLRKQPFSNGKVGTAGASAMGITQLLLAPTSPPGLACQYVLVASGSSYHHASYVGGAFRKCQVEGWLEQNRFHPDSLKRVREHPLYDDEWRRYDTLRAAERVRVPAIHIGGWYDTFCQGTIDAFTSRQLRGGEGARGRQKLVMGPWTHGGHRKQEFGEFRLPEPARSLPFDAGPQRWFDHWLKGVENGAAELPAVTYYVMGPFDGSPSSGNVWRSAESWPVPAEETSWYPDAAGGMREGTVPPAAERSYTYDPADPCPTLGGRNLNIPAGPRDQRPIEKRSDVLVFTSEVLAEELEVTGRLRAEVYLSSDREDTDVAVRFCDVYPDGRSVQIAEGIRRAALSHDFSAVNPLKTGEVRKVEVDLWSTSIAFAKGHRVRVSISSANFPHWEASPNALGPGGSRGKPKVARNTIHFGGERPTRLVLPVVRRGGSR